MARYRLKELVIKTFEEIQVSDEIKKALTEMGFSEPTSIQAEVIPFMLSGNDCLAQAPTGTGKTCAFGIPIVNSVDCDDSLVQSLVLCPTRELAMQIERELKKIAAFTRCRILALFGGQNIERQMAGLRRKPHIVVGTPGRVIDHIRRKTLKLHGLKTLVLDEADEMLDMGFRGDIDLVIQKLPKIRQTALFSATMAKEILEISKSYQVNPIMVKTKVGEREVPEISQYYVKLKEETKYEALKRIMRERNFKFVLVFCNTKLRVDALYEKLDSDGFLCAGLHGDLRQRTRDKIMKSYRAKALNILVATDVAARGIDVDNIEAIFNYDLPLDEEYYVHRIGRTARANKSGEAISFVTKKDIYRLDIYEKLTKTPIEEMVLDGISEGFNAKGKDENHTKFFINVGTKDGLNEIELKNLLFKNGGIDVGRIKNVRVCELFSFFEVENDLISESLKLNGIKFNGRFINVEESTDSKNNGKPQGRNKKSFNNNSNARGNFGGKGEFQGKKDSGKKSNRNAGTTFAKDNDKRGENRNNENAPKRKIYFDNGDDYMDKKDFRKDGGYQGDRKPDYSKGKSKNSYEHSGKGKSNGKQGFLSKKNKGKSFDKKGSGYVAENSNTKNFPKTKGNKEELDFKKQNAYGKQGNSFEKNGNFKKGDTKRNAPNSFNRSNKSGSSYGKQSSSISHGQKGSSRGNGDNSKRGNSNGYGGNGERRSSNRYDGNGKNGRKANFQP